MTTTAPSPYQPTRYFEKMFALARKYESLMYMWRPWAKTQNDGTHTTYAKQLWWDHSFSYDDSAYQCPQAHDDQKTNPGAYYKNYNFLYPHNKAVDK